MPFCWLLNLRNIFKICKVKHQCLAVTIFSGHKAAKPKRSAHLSPLQPVCNHSCGYRLQFKSDLSTDTCLNLFRCVCQGRAHHRYASWRVAQHITLCQGRYAMKTVVTSLRCRHVPIRPLAPQRAGSWLRLPSARSSSWAMAQSRPSSCERSGGAAQHR